MAEKSGAKKKVDPFKTKKTKESTAVDVDTLTPPSAVAQAIDAFREAQDQAKHFEGEATVQKDTIVNYCTEEYTKRLLSGMNRSFKVLGNETMIVYVVMDSSAGLTEEELSEFSEQWGEKAAEELIVRDYGTVRFNSEVLEANYDRVVEALQSLPPDVLGNLFKPMLMKAKHGAAELAKKYAKSPNDLRQMLKHLKMKNYIR